MKKSNFPEDNQLNLPVDEYGVVMRCQHFCSLAHCFLCLVLAFHNQSKCPADRNRFDVLLSKEVLGRKKSKMEEMHRKKWEKNGKRVRDKE